MRIAIGVMLLVLAVPLLGCANKPDVELPMPPESPARPELVAQGAPKLAAPKPPAPAAAPEKGKRKKAEKADKSQDAKNSPPGWFSNYDQALAKAKSTGQPLLVLFH